MSPHGHVLRSTCAVMLAALSACSDGATAPEIQHSTAVQPHIDRAPDRDDERRDRGDVEVLSNQAVRARTGRTIAEWGAIWWMWAFRNPEVLGDLDGTYSALGDIGGPVFLAEGSGGDPVRANVSVPGNQYVLLPVATYIWTFFDPCAELACARRIVNRNFIDGIRSIEVTVDGKRVPNIQSHLVRVDDANPPFRIDAGPIGPDGYGGILPAVQGGYWLMLAPLRSGNHRVSWSVTAPIVDGYTGERTDGVATLSAKLSLQGSRAPRTH